MTYRTRRRPGHLGIRPTPRHHWRTSRAGPSRTPLRLGPAPIRRRAEVRADYVIGALVLLAVAVLVANVALWAAHRLAT